ncbi:MAG: cell envelope integrity EipB family protein [Rhizobiaceae bacterium]
MGMNYLAKPILAFACVSTLVSSHAMAAGIDHLRPHRAVYDLSLQKASDRSGITGMQGRIVYEMTGSKCEGFAVRFRFMTNIQTPRKNFTNDQRTTSFESGDGSTFSFVQQSYLNGQLEQDLRGEAKRDTTGTHIAITKPDQEQVELGESVFMTQHIGMLIDAAKKQQTILTARVYDASDDGNELMDTTAIIGKLKAVLPTIKGEPSDITSLFKGKAAWPVSVSYFSHANMAGGGEKLPIYSVSFLMHESGVSRELKMQYADYSLRGDLKNLEYLKVDKCEQ